MQSTLKYCPLRYINPFILLKQEKKIIFSQDISLPVFRTTEPSKSHHPPAISQELSEDSLVGLTAQSTNGKTILQEGKPVLKTSPTTSTLSTQSTKEDSLPQTMEPMCSMTYSRLFCSSFPLVPPSSSKKLSTTNLISFGKNPCLRKQC